MNKLYVVPTPIGNLDDITLRAINILNTAELILAEDTRVSKKLLNHFKIETKLFSFHQFNEHKNLNKIIGKLQNDCSMALISDAGTPGISDPGFLLIRECLRNDIEIECLPGATAFVPALINSGLPSDRFIFEGFLPVKKGRLKRMESLQDESRSMVFYESPHRIIKTLTQFIEYFGRDREVSVSREITKIYEETKRGKLLEVLEYFSNKKPKGEFVIIVSGKK